MKLANFDEVLAQLDAIERAPPAPTGSWTLAQSLAHCAQSIELSLTGYPKLKPWLVRALVGPLVKRRFLSRGQMSHDIAAPIAGAPPLGEPALPDAAARLRKAVASFRAHDGALQPHLVYGDCSKAEYEQLHAMHVADHLTGRPR